MTELLKEVISYSFKDLGLRRLEANYIPRNVRSEKLLNRLGFKKIGYDKSYLVINGIEEPHNLTSINVNDWKN